MPVNCVSQQKHIKIQHEVYFRIDTDLVIKRSGQILSQ